MLDAQIGYWKERKKTADGVQEAENGIFAQLDNAICEQAGSDQPATADDSNAEDNENCVVVDSTGGSPSLREAGAEIAKVEHREQAIKQHEKNEKDARWRLNRAAHEILKDSFERLWGGIHLEAPTATRTLIERKSHPKFEVPNRVYGLGKGRIVIPEVFRETPMHFPQLGWDTITYTKIRVEQESPGCVLRAALVYTRPRTPMTIVGMRYGTTTALIIRGNSAILLITSTIRPNTTRILP